MDAVIIGMDPHKRSATIEVMAGDESVLGRGRYGTQESGYRAMVRGWCLIRANWDGNLGGAILRRAGQRPRTCPAAIRPSSNAAVPVVTTGSCAANSRSACSSSVSTTARP